MRIGMSLSNQELIALLQCFDMGKPEMAAKLLQDEMDRRTSEPPAVAEISLYRAARDHQEMLQQYVENLWFCRSCSGVISAPNSVLGAWVDCPIFDEDHPGCGCGEPEGGAQ